MLSLTSFLSQKTRQNTISTLGEMKMAISYECHLLCREFLSFIFPVGINGRIDDIVTFPIPSI